MCCWGLRKGSEAACCFGGMKKDRRGGDLRSLGGLCEGFGDEDAAERDQTFVFAVEVVIVFETPTFLQPPVKCLRLECDAVARGGLESDHEILVFHRQPLIFSKRIY